MRLLSSLAVALAAATLATSAGAQGGPRGFPHNKHAKLFVSCTSCHAGIPSGDAARAFPAPTACAQCHDDRTQKTVNWSGPSKRATNLQFSHTVHAAKSTAAGTPAQCVSCHAAQADTGWMRVQGARATGCITCHAHQATEHLAETAVCSTCHVTLADAKALTSQQIAAFPKPASHTKPGFAAQHAPAGSTEATCATCHTRESCARCHANASRVPAIARLATDQRVAELMKGRTAAYSTPSSHLAAGFASAHGAAASAAPQTCANCHTQQSCRSCHTGTRGQSVIASLPATGTGSATGVVLADLRVHASGFLTGHRSAPAGRLDCQGCHAQRECTSCHEGSSSRRYHPLDFVSRHAPAAYAQDQTCTSCHRTETFCRSCHLNSSMAAAGARTGAAHTAQPLWLLQHGEAARRGLTGCTTCHQQRDCLRCHSSLGLKVNPHGPNFDASRLSARNKQMCATCHVSDPLQSGR
jgi:class III cytochrome C family protein/doubled CXXCH motif protein